MAIEGPKLNVRGRSPESEPGKALHRYRRKAATEYRKAITRHKFGTLGPASKVRRIDPSEYAADEQKAAALKQHEGPAKIYSECLLRPDRGLRHG